MKTTKVQPLKTECSICTDRVGGKKLKILPQ